MDKNNKFKQKYVGSTAPKPRQKYTGTAMIGIVQQHKSNAQPIFNLEAAKDSAKMRRG